MYEEETRLIKTDEKLNNEYKDAAEALAIARVVSAQ